MEQNWHFTYNSMLPIKLRIAICFHTYIPLFLNNFSSSFVLELFADSS